MRSKLKAWGSAMFFKQDGAVGGFAGVFSSYGNGGVYFVFGCCRMVRI